jgi:hypothetical protein
MEYSAKFVVSFLFENLTPETVYYDLGMNEELIVM